MSDAAYSFIGIRAFIFYLTYRLLVVWHFTSNPPPAETPPRTTRPQFKYPLIRRRLKRLPSRRKNTPRHPCMNEFIVASKTFLRLNFCCSCNFLFFERLEFRVLRAILSLSCLSQSRHSHAPDRPRSQIEFDGNQAALVCKVVWQASHLHSYHHSATTACSRCSVKHCALLLCRRIQ